MEGSFANEQPVSQVILAAEAKKAHYQANYCGIFLMDLWVTAQSVALVQKGRRVPANAGREEARQERRVADG